MKVLIYRGDDDRWVAECPSLPGCISQGTTRAEAIENIKEAIDLYLEDLKESGESEPREFDGELVEV